MQYAFVFVFGMMAVASVVMGQMGNAKESAKFAVMFGIEVSLFMMLQPYIHEVLLSELRTETKLIVLTGMVIATITLTLISFTLLHKLFASEKEES